MADDWKPGDLALCVDAGRRPCLSRKDWAHLGNPALMVGRVYEVLATGPGGQLLGSHDDCKCPSLRFLAGVGAQERFRKIHPHAPDAEDAETLRLLNGTPAPKVPA